MTLTLRYAARSDRGLIRGGNQDSVYAGPRLLAVADGMGGMAAGDVASNIVIAAMAPLDEDVPGNAMIDALRGAVDTANQQIRDAVDANPALEGMGTTLTGMLFSGSKIGMVHIGDSRAYLLRGGEFAQVTKDDTYVQMLVDEGRISLEGANSHPQRSLLTRALDGRDADPEYSVRQAMASDRYLICSDGLSGVVSAETIEATLREYDDPQACTERLIQLALRGRPARRAARRARRWRVVRLERHPVPVLRRCHQGRHGRGVPRRARPGRRGAPVVGRGDQRAEARRPHPRRAEQRQAGHPVRQRGGRAAQARRAHHRRSVQQQRQTTMPSQSGPVRDPVGQRRAVVHAIVHAEQRAHGQSDRGGDAEPDRERHRLRLCRSQRLGLRGAEPRFLPGLTTDR